ncbi:MAG: SRPBCC family protein [Candidatus Dormibacterales bacterium]
MTEFVARRLVGAPPEAVFEFLADHRNATRVLDGVTRWEPLGARVRGVGARFDVEMRALGMPVAARLVLDVWDPPNAIGWSSESGPVPQRGDWTLRPAPGGTEVELKISYQPPGRAAGLVAAALEWTVRRRLESALAAIGGRLAPGPARDPQA